MGKFKKSQKIVIILIISFIMLFYGVFQIKSGLVQRYSYIKETAEDNLGILNEYVTTREKNLISNLMLINEVFKEDRVEAHKLKPGLAETIISFIINEKLAVYMDKYILDWDSYYSSMDTYYEDEEVYECEDSGNQMLSQLKGAVSSDDYEIISELIGEDDADWQIYDILAEYDNIPSDIITSFLVYNGNNELKALYNIDESLNLSYVNIEPVIKESNGQEKYLEIWERIKRIIPEEDLKNFKELYFATDGEYNELASVMPYDKRGKSWIMVIDPIDADLVDDEELFYETILHEYFHYITLNNKQAIYTEDYDLDYYCEEGMVTKEDSYLNQFYQRFWTSYLDDRLINEESEYFYYRHINDFVGEYAATNPSEDIAETFVVFVLCDMPEGNSIMEEKIKFFYEYDELVKLRDQLRNNIFELSKNNT